MGLDSRGVSSPVTKFLRFFSAILFCSVVYFLFFGQASATTSRASRGISIDGQITDWNLDEQVYEDSGNDSPYGIASDLHSMYATWDNSNFYLAVAGADSSKALVVYISTGLNGLTDSAQLRNTSGGADNQANWWCKHTFPADATPMFQELMRHARDHDGSHGFSFREFAAPARENRRRCLISPASFGAVKSHTVDHSFEASPLRARPSVPATLSLKSWQFWDGEGKGGKVFRTRHRRSLPTATPVLRSTRS